MASTVTLYVAFAACALAQSSRPPEPKQDEAAAKRDQERNDQLRSIATELKAIRERQAQGEERAARQEAGDNKYFAPNNASQWVLAILAALAALVAARSLRAIDHQAVETAKAANAAKASADATAGQLKLAAATYLDLKDLVYERHVRDNGTIMAVTVGYKLTNMSPNVARNIAVTKRFAIKGQPLRDDAPFVIDMLPPGKGYATKVRIDITEFHNQLLHEGMLKVVFHLMASWIDPTIRLTRSVTARHTPSSIDN